MDIDPLTFVVGLLGGSFWTGALGAVVISMLLSK